MSVAAYDAVTYARFWSKVKMPDAPRSDNLCWIWSGSTAKGYGQIKVHGCVLRSHRVAFEMFNGPLKDGEHVLHSCDNPLCVNPNHMRAGSHADNMQDKKERGRVWRGGPRNVFG